MQPVAQCPKHRDDSIHRRQTGPAVYINRLSKLDRHDDGQENDYFLSKEMLTLG
jgi:hypothetical protein